MAATGVSDDDEESMDEPLALPAAAIEVTQSHELQVRIQSISVDSTLNEIVNVSKTITHSLRHASDLEQIGELGMCYCSLIDQLSSLATVASDKFLDDQKGSDDIGKFVTDQLASTSTSSSRIIESRAAEEQRYGVGKNRSLIGVA